jgi:hypothetical protein
VSRTRLCAVKFDQRDGRDLVLKRRLRYSFVILYGCNLITRRRKVPLSFLGEPEWLLWEPRVYDALYGVNVGVDESSWMAIPTFQGRVMSEILGDRSLTCQDKMKAVSAAIQSLRELHETRLGADAPPLSHGDATVRNVIYDSESGLARWIDFEQSHDLSVDPQFRCADDLRAFVFSAAACLDADDLPGLVSVVVDSYRDELVLCALRVLVEGPSLWFDLYHLAQSCASISRQSLFRAILLDRLVF